MSHFSLIREISLADRAIMRSRFYYIFIVVIFAALGLQSLALAADKDVSTKASVSKSISKIIKKISRTGVKSIPSTSSSVSSSSSSSLNGFDPLISSVSGVPPTLSELALATDIELIFWRAGIVSAIGTGSPDPFPDQCSEFFASDTDGESGGMGACRMAAGVGEAFETIIHSETSLCYLKNFPTQANLDAGAITLVSGAFPGGKVAKLFAPGAKLRYVKVNVTPPPGKGEAESLYVKIPSKSSNEKQNLAYSADMYFCPEGEESPRGFNKVRAKIKMKDGEPSAVDLKVTIGNTSDPFGGGSNSLVFEGNLALEGGNVKFDKDSKRSVLVNHIHNGTDKFKAHIEIRGNDRIYLKRMGSFTQGMFENNHKDYTISNFTGDSVKNAAFLEGAFQGEDNIGPNSKSFSGATEYRDTYYASSPNSSLLSDVESLDFDTDSFFTTEPEVDVDVSPYSCSVVPDIEVNMDGGNDTLEAALSTCFPGDFQNLDFCKNDSDVFQAEQNFHSVCPPPGPP